MTGLAVMGWLSLLFVLVMLAAVVFGVVLLVRRHKAGKSILAETRHRDRAVLARLEELDNRLERLERTLHELPF
ncbi:hypothetical protein [Paeniglutamicibacter cryotolerans]|uniref:Uncharacterized protein n=1 Tax=Paeniglutamicibacter cryotolerans TaxID=670079 RepID=A0A839QMY3_9MICC|nr:hypothetical protein [Paeniglutamicibacter cryotolerans]MBB2995356.1 hypothetical protein [Paeniglutamicibacter cryotolerans]